MSYELPMFTDPDWPPRRGGVGNVIHIGPLAIATMPPIAYPSAIEFDAAQEAAAADEAEAVTAVERAYIEGRTEGYEEGRADEAARSHGLSVLAGMALGCALMACMLVIGRASGVL